MAEIIKIKRIEEVKQIKEVTTKDNIIDSKKYNELLDEILILADLYNSKKTDNKFEDLKDKLEGTKLTDEGLVEKLVTLMSLIILDDYQEDFVKKAVDY